jgi:outer membrane immunogenic protein
MIKAVVWVATLSVAFGATVFGGSDEYSGREMKAVAPAPVACNWTGFYVGASGGYTFGSIDPRLSLSGFFDTIEKPEGDDLERLGSQNLNANGANAGGLLGYNYQWKNWMFGGEGAGSYLWLRNSRDDLSSVRDLFTISSSVKTHYLFTVGPRIGYALGCWMPYVTGGVAVGDMKFSQNIHVPVGQQGHGFALGNDDTETKAGWMIGGGLEYAISHHWRLRGQYQYVDLGSVNFHTVGSGFALAGNYNGDHRAELREHNVSVALVYGF